MKRASLMLLAVAALVAPARAEHPFSTLRLPATPAKWAEQREMLAHVRGGFDEVWFSACNFKSLDENRARAKWLADAARDVRALGYRASLEFELTIGNADSPASERMPFKDWTGFTGPDGWEGVRCNCPRDPKFWNYFREQLKDYCAWRPYAVWLDDDVRVENHGRNRDGCYCPRCIAAFSQAEGRAWTREALVAAMKTDPALAARWRRHCFAGLAAFAGAFAKAVKEFSPATKLGFQYPWADEGQLLIVEAMAAAAGGQIEMRPGSCHYDDRDPFGLLGKTYRLERQLKTLLKRPELYSRLCPEIETYPRTFTMRTAKSLAFEALTHLSTGLDSLTWYIAGGAEPCALYERTVMRAPVRNLPLYREYVRRNRGTRAVGFDAPAYPLGQWSPNVDARIATSGIPYNFAPGVRLGMALWDSGDFRALDDATLRGILAGSVVADLPAVRELVRRQLLPPSAAALKTEDLSDSSVSHPKLVGTPQGGRLAVFPSLDPYSVSSATLLDYTRLADAACGGRLPVLPETPVLDAFFPRVFADGSFASVVIVNTRIDRQEPLVLTVRGFRGERALWFGLDAPGPVERPAVRDAATGDVRITVPSLDAWSGGFLTVAAPDFAGHPFAAQLDELRREIVGEIDGGRPLPNKTVYRTPWRRDGAMVAMALEKTGELGLIRDWILSLDDPFDRNNGCEEPDNIGETLYLLGCVTNSTHPAVGKIVSIAKSRLDPNGVLTGTVDGANHPVYAMKWLRLGLEKCGLDARWVRIPDVKDDFYDGLFWMDGTRDPVCATAEFNRNYPYLSWANWHKGGRTFTPAEVPVKPGLMTWEAFASKANYAAFAKTHPDWAENRIAYPHTWHAAEMFLLLWDRPSRTPVPALAVWDFDGTILKGDCSEGLKGAYPGLVTDCILAGFAADYRGEEGVARFWRAYEGKIAAGRKREAYEDVARIFAGARVDEIEAFARRRFAETMKGFVFAYSLERFRELASRGVENHVVSASPDFFVQAAAETLGVPRSRVHGIQMGVKDGRLVNRIDEPFPYGDGKTAWVRKLEKASGRKALYGFGNSYGTDGPFLKAIALQGGTSLMINGGKTVPGMTERFVCTNLTATVGSSL